MDWITWSPFQSVDVKAICQHITPQEKQTSAVHGAVAGVMIAIFFVAPLVFFVVWGRGVFGAILAIAIFAYVWRFGVRRLHRQQKEFLCSTEWARQQGYDPDSLQVRSF